MTPTSPSDIPPSPAAAAPVGLTAAQQKEIEDNFRFRLKNVHGIEPLSGSATREHARKLEVEYFTGAMAAVQAFFGTTPELKDTLLVPPVWYIAIIRGQGILEAIKAAEIEGSPVPTTVRHLISCEDDGRCFYIDDRLFQRIAFEQGELDEGGDANVSGIRYDYLHSNYA